jgi:hypothetical protein
VNVRVARLEGWGADMTMRWKRRSILALAVLIIFCSVPLPNVLLPNVPLPSFVVRHLVTRSDFQASIQATCRLQARVMQSAVSASTDVASLEARLWGPISQQRCREWRPYVGG